MAFLPEAPATANFRGRLLIVDFDFFQLQDRRFPILRLPFLEIQRSLHGILPSCIFEHSVIGL